MTSFETLLFDVTDGVGVITLNRPEKYNSADETLVTELENLYKELRYDDSVKVVVLTGAGDKAFCTGIDRDFAMNNRQPDSPFMMDDPMLKLGPKQADLWKPVIAAVNGAAVGAGNDLACMCDIRIAASSARFAESFVKLGIIPGDGGCWLLPRTIGMSRAAEMALTGDMVDATQALAMGLVSSVVAPQELVNAALSLAERIAANPPQALRWTKQLLQQGRQGTLDDALHQAGVLQGQAHQTADHAEAINAFFEKRQPVFRG